MFIITCELCTLCCLFHNNYAYECYRMGWGLELYRLTITVECLFLVSLCGQGPYRNCSQDCRRTQQKITTVIYVIFVAASQGLV